MKDIKSIHLKAVVREKERQAERYTLHSSITHGPFLTNETKFIDDLHIYSMILGISGVRLKEETTVTFISDYNQSAAGQEETHVRNRTEP